MALATTIQQVKAAHPRLLSGLSSTAMMPNLAAAEEKYLVPLVGRALYDDINSQFAANTLAGDELTLHQYMLAVSVAGAYVDELPRNTGKITDNGNRTAQSNEMQRMFGWEYKEFKQGITDLYYDSIEVLLVWLDAHAATFPLFEDSDQHNRFKNLLIKSAGDFNDQYRLYQPWRTYWMMRGIVLDVQDSYIKATMGADLLTYFLELASPTDDEKDIIKALKKAMAFLTIFRCCRMHTVRFSDSGFSIISYVGDTDTGVDAGGRTAASTSILEHHMRSMEQDGLQHLQRAKTLCIALRAEGSVTGFNTAYDAGPLVDNVEKTFTEKNAELSKGFRFGA